MDDPETIRPQASIPVVEEVVNISKRKVITGSVRVEKSVESLEYIVSEDLRHESTEIERFVFDTEVDPDNPPQARIENGVTIIPVLEEVLVVEKRLILKEELHIRKTVSEVRSSQPVTLKKERLTYNRSDSAKPDDPEELPAVSAPKPDSSLT